MDERIEKALARLMVSDPFWGRLAQDIIWREMDRPFCMGVSISRHGGFNAYYNPKMIEEWLKNDIKYIQEIIKHELWHIILQHLQRVKRNVLPIIQNIAMDMVVNGPKEDKRLGVPEESVWCKYEWKEYTSEQILEELLKNSDCKNCPTMKAMKKLFKQSGDDENKGDGQDENKQGKCALSEAMGECPYKRMIFDDHGFGFEGADQMSESEYRQFVANKIENASKMAGNMPGDVQAALEKLKDPIVNWRAELRLAVSRAIGGKRRSFKRRNRRLPLFGIPGITHKSKSRILVAVDNSLSISDDMLEQFFAEIESLSQNYVVSVVQWDVGIKKETYWKSYHRGDWRRIKIVGRGGTDLDQTLDEAEEMSIISDCNIILSDMCFGNVKPRRYNLIWVTTDSEPPEWAEHIISLKEK